MAEPQELRFNGFTSDPSLDVEATLAIGTTFIWDLTEDNPTDEDCAFCDPAESLENVNAFDIAVPTVHGEIALKGALGMLRPARHQQSLCS